MVVYKLYGLITGVIRPISSRPTHEGHLHKQHRRTFCYDVILILQELPKKKHFDKNSGQTDKDTQLQTHRLTIRVATVLYGCGLRNAYNTKLNCRRSAPPLPLTKRLFRNFETASTLFGYKRFESIKDVQYYRLIFSRPYLRSRYWYSVASVVVVVCYVMYCG